MLGIRFSSCYPVPRRWQHFNKLDDDDCAQSTVAIARLAACTHLQIVHRLFVSNCPSLLAGHRTVRLRLWIDDIGIFDWPPIPVIRWSEITSIPHVKHFIASQSTHANMRYAWNAERFLFYFMSSIANAEQLFARMCRQQIKPSYQRPRTQIEHRQMCSHSQRQF